MNLRADQMLGGNPEEGIHTRCHSRRPAELPRSASDVAAQAIVGAGESLANWWLEHQEIPREQLADWYAQVVQASIRAIVTRSSTKGRR